MKSRRENYLRDVQKLLGNDFRKKGILHVRDSLAPKIKRQLDVVIATDGRKYMYRFKSSFFPNLTIRYDINGLDERWKESDMLVLE